MRTVILSFIAGVLFTSILFVLVIFNNEPRALIGTKTFGDVSIIPTDAEDMLIKDSKRLSVIQDDELVLSLEFVKGKKLRNLYVFQGNDDCIFFASRSLSENEWDRLTYGSLDIRKGYYSDLNADGSFDYIVHGDTSHILSNNQLVRVTQVSPGKFKDENNACYSFLSDAGWLKEDCDNDLSHEK